MNQIISFSRQTLFTFYFHILLFTEEYSSPCQSPKKELSAITVNDYHHKMLHLRCVRGSKSALEIPPGRNQTERMQVTQITLGKKATGDKHRFCLCFSQDIHPISPTFIKLLFKTVTGSCVDDIERKAVPVIYNTVIEKMLTYCSFEG